MLSVYLPAGGCHGILMVVMGYQLYEKACVYIPLPCKVLPLDGLPCCQGNTLTSNEMWLAS